MKTVKFILLAFIACFLVSTLFAQDSTLVKIAQNGLSAIEVKYSWIAPVLGVLFLISEGLSAIPSVKANSIYQLIFSWFKAILGK